MNFLLVTITGLVAFVGSTFAQAENPVDPAKIREQIEAMRVKDVAWRQIGWKTCLLDGLKASREQRKPLVLWVFIDRPVDDKRC